MKYLACLIIVCSAIIDKGCTEDSTKRHLQCHVTEDNGNSDYFTPVVLETVKNDGDCTSSVGEVKACESQDRGHATAVKGETAFTRKQKTARSSQQATELLVSSWSNLSSWSKRNETSSICERDVERAIFSYIDNELWALKMFDAWAKPGPSLLDGRSSFVGNYYQCREIKAPNFGKNMGFKGNYCVVTLANVTVDLNLTQFLMILLARVQLGTCVPDSCTEDDVTRLFQERLETLGLDSLLQAVSTDCRTEVREFTLFTKLAIGIILIIGVLTGLGTAVDVATACWPACSTSQQPGKDHSSDSDKQTQIHKTDLWMRFLVSFSAYSNGRALLSTSEVPGSISAISGIKFLTMMWIITSHTYYLLFIGYASNAVRGNNAIVKYRIFDFVNNTLGVDSFFALSGFLLSYHKVKEIIEKGQKFNWGLFFLHRYWRLTPTFLIALVLIQGLQRFMVSGALASTVQPADKAACERNWWLLPLYINNLYRTNVQDMCFGHSWSLGADMQFHILSPLMLISFHFHKYAGIASCLLFVLGQWILAGVLSYHFKATMPVLSNSFEWLSQSYYPSYAKIAPFALGILSGYILSANNGRLQMKRHVVAVGWVMAMVEAVAVVFGVHGDLSGESQSSLLAISVYKAVSGAIFGSCVLWVIVACASGYGGPVNAILSWAPFKVLGRLTFVGFLIHISVLTVIFENLEQPAYLNLCSVIVFQTACLVFTCILAAILTVCVEMPTLKLEKILSGGHNN